MSSPQERTMEEMSLQQVSDIILSAQFPVLVGGAGVSFGAAPLAKDLKTGILEGIMEIAEIPGSDPLYSHAFEEVREAYLTLEVIVSALTYRIPELSEGIQRFYSELFVLKNTNCSIESIARSFCQRRPAVIMTGNFDDGLYAALDRLNYPYRIVTDNNAVNCEPRTSDICAFHGTIHKESKDDSSSVPSPPTSVTARELAHPFIPSMSKYIQACFQRSDCIIFVGYRGEDFYDFNLEISRFLDEPSDPSERSARLRKLYCIPHGGEISAISEFFRQILDPANVIKLAGTPDEWLSNLFDLVSGSTISKKNYVKSNTTAADIAKLFVSRLDNNAIASKCRAFVQDICNGVLAVWAVAEHYRLESLGLAQTEIGSFGRIPKERLVFGVRVGDMISLQEQYWIFNSTHRAAQRDGLMLPTDQGLRLYQQLKSFEECCQQGYRDAERHIDKACMKLLSAISYDYMGLLAMRLHQSSPDAVGHWDSLFTSSWESSEDAEAEIASESEEFDGLRGYSDSLSNIVVCAIWKLAAQENYARSDSRSLQEKFVLLSEVINKRLGIIRNEYRKGAAPLDSINFAVTGHAVQCVLRITELIRALARVKEKFPPQFGEWIDLDQSEVEDRMQEFVRESKYCLEVAENLSSRKDPQFISAFDAMVLYELYGDNINAARQIIEQAEIYAGQDTRFKSRMNDLRTRVPV